MNRPLQYLLIQIYSAVKKTGFLQTRMGEAIFDHFYLGYKKYLEARDIHLLKRFYIPGSHIIDIGANIGFFTEHFAKWVAPTIGGVIAIEPEPENYARLNKRLTRLKLQDYVSTIQAAVADVSGPLHLMVNPEHPGDHQLAETGLPVNGITIDDIIRQKQWPDVSLIKIDVQGAETRVIHGARETLLRLQPTLYIEVSETDLNRHGSSSEKLVNLLGSLNYEMDPSYNNDDFSGSLSDDANAYRDILFRPARSYLNTKEP